MKLNNAIRRELVFVAAGLAVGDALICAVFALLHKFDYTVPLGAVWGSAFAFLNVYLLALRVQKVADSEDADKKIAQNRLRCILFPWFSKTRFTLRKAGRLLPKNRISS